MNEGRDERARDRENIRQASDTVVRGAGEAVAYEERATLHVIEMLEQLVLAVCNLAETLDSRSSGA